MMLLMFVPIGIQLATFVFEWGYDSFHARLLEERLEFRQKLPPIRPDDPQYSSNPEEYYDYDPEPPRSDPDDGISDYDRSNEFTIILTTSTLTAPPSSAPTPTLGPFISALLGHYRKFYYYYCPEPFGRRKCVYSEYGEDALMHSQEGVFCKDIGLCISAQGLMDDCIDCRAPIEKLMAAYNVDFQKPWRLCYENFTKCFKFNSTESLNATTAVVEPDFDGHLISGAVNLTATWLEHPESARMKRSYPTVEEEDRKYGEEKEKRLNRVEANTKSMGGEEEMNSDQFNEKPNATKMLHNLGPSATERIKQPWNGSSKLHKKRHSDLSPSEVETVKSKNECPTCLRYYWLRKFIMQLPLVLMIISLPIYVWFFIIYYRKPRQYGWWLKVQFLYVLLNYTAVLWICTFLICDYHPDKELMIIACIHLLFQIVIFFNSIACLFLVKYFIRIPQLAE